MERHEEELELINRIRTAFLTKKLKTLSLLLTSIPNNLKTTIDLFIRKSLIKEDKYDYNEQNENGKLELPANTVIERHQSEEYHRRLKKLQKGYLTQYTKLKDIDQITEEFLDETRELLTCFNFSRLSYHNPNTRLFKQLVEQAFESNRTDEKNITAINQQMVAKSHGELQLLLEELSRFMDDFYKLNLRFQHLFRLPEEEFNQALFETNPSKYIEELKEHMRFHAPNFPFIELYITGALHDLYNLDREEAIGRFKEEYLTEEDSKAVHFPPEYELQLLIKRSTTLINPFNQIINLLNANYKAYFKSKTGSLKKVLYLLSKVLGIKLKEEDELIIYYFEPGAKKYIHEKISFHHFAALFHEKVNGLKELKDPKSRICNSLRKLSLSRLQNYFRNYYLELFTINEKLSGLENEFITVLKGNTIGKKRVEKLKASIDAILAKMRERHSELFNKKKVMMKR